MGAKQAAKRADISFKVTELGAFVERKGRPEKKRTGWCSDNETGGGDAKQRDKT
jgi:hypothetical protein